ncbi:MAG: CBS domain-containing protein [Candidatus Thiodiazotropha taylori]
MVTLESLKLNDYMVSTETPLREVAEMMSCNTIRAVLVHDNNIPTGIFTERDAVSLAVSETHCGDLLISEVMSTHLITARDNLNVLDAYKLMNENSIRHLIVLNDRNEASGIVSEHEISTYLFSIAQLNHMTINSIMTKNVIAADIKDSLRLAVRCMINKRLSYIVVGHNGSAVGLLTESDVLRTLCQETALMDSPLQDFIQKPTDIIYRENSVTTLQNRLGSHKSRHIAVYDDSDNWLGVLSNHNLLQMYNEEALKTLPANNTSNYSSRLSDFSLSGIHTLRENRDFRILFNTIPYPVYIKDQELRLKMVNKAYLDFTKLEIEQVIGKTDAEIFSKSQSNGFSESDLYVLNNGKAISGEFQKVYTPSEELHWFWTSKSPLTNSTGKVVGLVGISTDVTSLKHLTDNQLSNEKVLRKTLIQEVNHRIKNHLQGVVGMLSNIKYSCNDVDKCLDKAITQIRTIATVYGMHSKFHNHNINIHELITACINMYNPDDTKNVCINIHTNTDSYLDKKESVPIALVINELLTNAIKHSYRNNNDVEINIKLHFQDGIFRLTITNLSQGLPSNIDYDNQVGLGSGLKLVHTLLPQRGSSFSIKFKDDYVVSELILESPFITDNEYSNQQ